jgi:mannosyltransferase
VVSNLVLFVGLRRAAYKRFDLAIDAVRLSSPELQLGIVGECLTPPEIELLNAKLNHRWSYLGAVADAKLRELYSASHALIYPSDFEGFGLPVLEAMSCGCPVIAFGSSSLPEVGGDAALYALNQDPFEYSLLLNSLLSPDCRRAAMLQGLQRVKSFDWEVVFDKTFALYRSLI